MTKLQRKGENDNGFSYCSLSDGRQTLISILWFDHILSLFLSLWLEQSWNNCKFDLCTLFKEEAERVTAITACAVHASA